MSKVKECSRPTVYPRQVKIQSLSSKLLPNHKRTEDTSPSADPGVEKP